MNTELLIKNLLINYGEDVNRDGLKETPKRVKKMYDEVLSGYNKDVKQVFKTFEINKYNGPISICNIKFYSLCEHHILPFYGTVDITYVPDKKVLGLSKFSRIVEIFARRLQIQERLTQEIAESIMLNLMPKSCTVTIRAEHFCMSSRGINKDNIVTTTTTTL